MDCRNFRPLRGIPSGRLHEGLFGCGYRCGYSAGGWRGADYRRTAAKGCNGRAHEGDCPITLDHEFVVHDIRVIDGNAGMFVAMPSKRTPDGEFRDIAHPITSLTRQRIQEAVLDEYYKSESMDSAAVGN